jgi:hypothetical protein
MEKPKPKDTIETPRSEMIAEHEKLVDVLNSPSHKDDKVEARKQAKELEEYKGGDNEKAPKVKRVTEIPAVQANEITKKAKIMEPHEQLYESPLGVELTVVRPNGVTETVRHPTLKRLDDALFKQMAIATKKAGKGELISYKNLTITKKAKITEADVADKRSEAVEREMTRYGR